MSDFDFDEEPEKKEYTEAELRDLRSRIDGELEKRSADARTFEKTVARMSDWEFFNLQRDLHSK